MLRNALFQWQGDFYGLVTEVQMTFCVILPALPSQQGLVHLQTPLLFILISQSCHSLNLPQIYAG